MRIIFSVLKLLVMIIDVIVKSARDLQQAYYLSYFGSQWREDGHVVRVVRAGSTDAPGDVGILHIDLTHIEPWITDWAARYGRVVNGALTDISKRAISRNLVVEHDAYSGPVIIKTDLNHGGKPERLASREDGKAELLASARRQIARRGGWRLVRQLPPGDYPVLESKSEVPAWVWRTKSLVVERFCPERQGAHYVTRIWVFFGAREYGRKEVSCLPTGRANRTIERVLDGFVPAEVRAFRAELGMDFGKIDWVYHAGKPVVFAANKTPARFLIPAGDDLRLMYDLSQGLFDMVGRDAT